MKLLVIDDMRQFTFSDTQSVIQVINQRFIENPGRIWSMQK